MLQYLDRTLFPNEQRSDRTVHGVDEKTNINSL